MFTKINVGDKVFVSGQEYAVTRVSNARFWAKVGEEDVKFVKTTGKEYGSNSTRKATKEAEPVAEAEVPAEAAPKPKRTRKAKAEQVEAQAEAPAVEVVEEAAAPTE